MTDENYTPQDFPLATVEECLDWLKDELLWINDKDRKILVSSIMYIKRMAAQRAIIVQLLSILNDISDFAPDELELKAIQAISAAANLLGGG